MLTFLSSNGYLDGIVRGYRGALLTTTQYTNLSHCDTIDDLRVQLATTDYGDTTEPSSLRERVRAKFVGQFKYLVDNAGRGSTLADLMKWIQCGYMIDNVILLLTGTADKVHENEEERPEHESVKVQREEELLKECHPLGMFDALPALTAVGQSDDQYSILQDTPIAPFLPPIRQSTNQNFELLRAQMWRRYLEDFHQWCNQSLDQVSAECMSYLLSNEADRRCLAIAINSLSAHRLDKQDRFDLIPHFGMMFEQGIAYRLSRADDLSAIKAVIDQHPVLSQRFPLDGTSQLEHILAAEEVQDCKTVFEFPSHHAVFYAWSRLKEQEARNVVWIGECIAQKQKDKVSEYIPLW